MSPLELLNEINQSTGVLAGKVREQERANSKIVDSIKELNGAVYKLSHSVVSLEINKNQLEEVREINRSISRYKSFSIQMTGISLFFLLSTLTTLFFAFKFYSTSVKSKQELKTDILHEITDAGKTITDIEELNTLIRYRNAIEQWKKDNPKDSRSWKQYESQIEQ